jgi:hypothetical protein
MLTYATHRVAGALRAVDYSVGAIRPAALLHTSAYVSIRQHTSAYASIRQHTSAYVSIRQHTVQLLSCPASIRQHTSAYVSIRQHTSAYVSIGPAALLLRQLLQESIRQHTLAYVSGELTYANVCCSASSSRRAYVSIR